MDFIVKDLDNNYRLDEFRNKADKIIFEISSEISTANCPYCGKESKRIHSRYQREVQDLPIQGKKVVLLVSTRKFYTQSLLYTHICKYLSTILTHIYNNIEDEYVLIL